MIVQSCDGRASCVHKIGDVDGVLLRQSNFERGRDWNALGIDDDNADDTLVARDALDGFVDAHADFERM